LITARNISPILRYLALVGVAAAFIGSTAVFALNQAQTGIETRQIGSTPPARPSYLMPLPKLTAKDFDVARAVPAVVMGKEAPRTGEPAPASQQVASIQSNSVSAGTVVVTVDAANVRSGPSKATAKVFVLRHGDVVEILSTQAGWSEVRGPDGQTGWIWTQFLHG
jgi:uncharacterized protein YgiM (DUF1202 family)